MAGKAELSSVYPHDLFSPFLLTKTCAFFRRAVDDLASLDPELYNGLMFLKNYTGDVETDLSLNFTVTEDGTLQSTVLSPSCLLHHCPDTHSVDRSFV